MGIWWSNDKPVEYVGAVLGTRERNYYDDSDFYAVVWDEERQCVKSVEYATTRFGGGGTASPDATEEVIQKVRDYYAPKIARSIIGQSQQDYEKHVKSFKGFHTGTQVRVKRQIKSKKQGVIPEGFLGILVWQGGPYHHNGDFRYGVKNVDTGQCFFVNESDLEYAGPEPTDNDVHPPMTLEKDYDRVLADVIENLKPKSGWQLAALYASFNPGNCVVV
jgi:hypothetical protein